MRGPDGFRQHRFGDDTRHLGRRPQNGIDHQRIAGPGNLSVSTLSFSGCTFPTKTLNGGTLHIAWTSGRNGTVSSSGAEVETGTPFGTCIYWTGAGTALGTFDGVAKTTEKAKITISAELELRKVVSGSCLTPTRWT